MFIEKGIQDYEVLVIKNTI